MSEPENCVTPKIIEIRQVDPLKSQPFDELLREWGKNVNSRITLYSKLFEYIMDTQWATDCIFHERKCSLEFFIHKRCIDTSKLTNDIVRAIDLLDNELERQRFSEIIRSNYRIFTLFTLNRPHDATNHDGPFMYTHKDDAHECLHVRFTIDL